MPNSTPKRGNWRKLFLLRSFGMRFDKLLFILFPTIKNNVTNERQNFSWCPRRPLRKRQIRKKFLLFSVRFNAKCHICISDLWLWNENSFNNWNSVFPSCSRLSLPMDSFSFWFHELIHFSSCLFFSFFHFPSLHDGNSLRLLSNIKNWRISFRKKSKFSDFLFFSLHYLRRTFFFIYDVIGRNYLISSTPPLKMFEQC